MAFSAQLNVGEYRKIMSCNIINTGSIECSNGMYL